MMEKGLGITRTKSLTLQRVETVRSAVGISITRDIDRSDTFVYTYLVLYSLLSGYINAVTFTATSVWVSAMTGNCIQLGMSIAQLFSPGSGPESSRRRFLHINDRHAICALFTFALAVQCGRIVELLGRKQRRTHAVSTLIQAALTGAAALTCFNIKQSDFASASTAPSWTNTAGFATMALLSGSMGLQGVSCEWIGAPHGATVVITSLFPQLGAMDWATFTTFGRQPVRDAKMVTIFVFCLGGMFGRGLVGALGAPLTLLIAAAIKLLMSVGWLFMRSDNVVSPVLV